MINGQYHEDGQLRSIRKKYINFRKILSPNQDLITLMQNIVILHEVVVQGCMLLY